MKNVEYIGNCVCLNGNDVLDFLDNCREITYDTFSRAVGGGVIHEMNEIYSVPLKKDWSVRFYSGVFRNEFVYCLVHSAVEHFWRVHKNR